MNGNEFKEWRNRANLSLRDIQAMTGVGFASVSRFENGRNIAIKHYQTLERLMKGEIIETLDKKEQIKRTLRNLEILLESED